jgi:hypothetical protein
MEVNVNTQKWFLVLIALALIGSVACAAPAAVTPAAKPTISSFSASPPSITQGQQTVLSWNVSGATTVTIQPLVGGIGLTGSLTLTPNATVTYTLTATNEAGSATGSVTINVTPVVAGMPDLVVTDLSLSGNQVYYKIKNQGNAEAGQTYTDFYIGSIDQALQKVQWFKQTTNFVDKLAPGEERTQRFSNYDWKLISANPIEATFITYNVMACANATKSITESNMNNDCYVQVWGTQFIYDFVQQAHLAKWTSGAGTLYWPMSSEYLTGAAYLITYNPILVICPQKVNNGWITGKFGDFYIDPAYKIALVRDLNIPLLAQFTSKVGFAPGVDSPDGVTVALGYVDELGSVVFFNKMVVKSDGQMHDYNVDLASLAGKHTQFVLWVQNNGSPINTCVRWDSPKITQKAGAQM